MRIGTPARLFSWCSTSQMTWPSWRLWMRLRCRPPRRRRLLRDLAPLLRCQFGGARLPAFESAPPSEAHGGGVFAGIGGGFRLVTGGRVYNGLGELVQVARAFRLVGA